MNPANYFKTMFGALAAAMERDKKAHRASINELAKLCPSTTTYLHVLHQEYCQRLDQDLAKARRLVNEPFPVGESHDPALLLLLYLTRTQPPGDQDLDPTVYDDIRRRFGLPQT